MSAGLKYHTKGGCQMTNGKCTLHKAIHEKVEEHHSALFDKKSGLAYCIKDKVSKKALWGNVLALIAISAGFIIASLNAWGDAKTERSNNKANIAVIQTNMQTKFDAIEKSIEEIKNKQMDTKELLLEIRKILNEKKTDGGRD
uniref:Uncharacterized protein n=1 Tax=viral metagenome TaxID=1070528 RepID=A0A6H2A4F5_9ZZZZ